MKLNFFSPLLFIISLPYLHNLHNVQAQPSTIGYNCTASNQSSSNTCQTYAFYRATPPDFLDLASIADLFSISRPMISNPSNISAPNSTLIPDQSLFVPIRCSCNTLNSSLTLSYAGLNYTIRSGDTFYLVSTHSFQNLTTYQSVEAVNPTFNPIRLEPGDVITFPIFCRCPNASQVRNQVNYLISYVYQTSDNLSRIASRFGSSVQSIIDINGNNISPADTIFIPVSRLPNLTQPIAPRLAPERDDRDGTTVGLGIGLGICGLILCLVCGIWYYREGLMKKKERKYRDEEKGQKGVKELLKGEEVTLMADVSGCLDKYKVFRIDDLRDATDGFDDKCIVQGSVYKGCIDGEWYAIKKMKWNAYEELKILQKVNHGNLVRLEGFCIDPEEANCYLVYEFVENGSLYSWLHENKNNEKLSWKTRLRIAIDVANGLQYIHEHTRPKVVHKDIKSSNILLDSNMRAKIANFGLAKSGCNAITMHIVGTQGYIAPEYLLDGVVSTKMDVFSFGVVLLELVSGKEAIDEGGNVLWDSVGGILDGNEERKLKKLREWMDQYLVNESSSSAMMESAMGVVAVGVACLNKDPTRRPSMVEIVYALSKSDDLFFDVSEDGLSPRQVIAR
ncbi:hypothetical protein BUALT_Bualt14G0104600 [Buddleja alternifolia]|uniref:Uncharacterized protein n=1 Tax=Buddleja alternifolia TaxID=168488 RepID=A0AAV6WTL2_9LAMI|nr:hypothetical protein BUALT_Bualt14G0104600 [Buddleja alternifolia]